MKSLLFSIIFLFNSIFCFSQLCTTLVAYDYIETYDWVGLWWLGAQSNYYNNASVSPSFSAVQYGVGASSSAIESDWYVMPNITGLNSSYTYIFQFRLGSYRFTNSGASTAGVDNADYVEVQLSTDGEITYVSEMRIRGNSNSYWDYNTNATASKTANGVLTVYTPAAGGNRTTTGDGFSIIKLQLPVGTTQCAVDLFCRANSAGEEWWIDNVELIQIAPCSPLPIELVSFSGSNKISFNQLKWSTATELNNSHFILERSTNTTEWIELTRIEGHGTVEYNSDYSYNDFSYIKNTTNYYRLKQVDFDNSYTYSSIIYINSDLSKDKCIDEYFTIDGKLINFETSPAGIYIHICGSSIEKVLKLD